MEEIKKVLQHYNVDATAIKDYVYHSANWLHVFSIGAKGYILVETETLGSDLTEDEYARVGIPKERLKLVLPKLEQMHTANNLAGIGIDGHRRIINADEWNEYTAAVEKAQKEHYFPPLTEDQLPKFSGKPYKNPNGLNTGTSWVLYEIK